MDNKEHKHWWLYVLKLEQGKWYVGITSQAVESRFKQHMSGFAAANWTRKYKPTEIHDTKDLGICDIEQAQQFEGKVTREYMTRYGDNNVRGGDLTDMDDYIRRFGQFITKEDWMVVTNVVLLLVLVLYIVLDRYIWHPPCY